VDHDGLGVGRLLGLLADLRGRGGRAPAEFLVREHLRLTLEILDVLARGLVRLVGAGLVAKLDQAPVHNRLAGVEHAHPDLVAAVIEGLPGHGPRMVTGPAPLRWSFTYAHDSPNTVQRHDRAQPTGEPRASRRSLRGRLVATLDRDRRAFYKPTTMKRILTTTLAVSVLVLPACKGGASADAVKLVPNEAEFIIGLSPKAIGESELYKSFAPEFEKESDYKEMVSIFEDCGLKPFEFDAVVVGANQGGEFVAVIAGNSVGKKDEAVCVIKNVQKQAGDEQIADVVKEGGKNVINFTDGRAYLVNDNMLALATTDWQDAVGELIDGKGTPAIENSKKDAMGKVDTKKAVWFVASVPAELAGMAALAGPEVTEV